MYDAAVHNVVGQPGSEAGYRAVVQSALDAIIVIDEFGRIQEFNPAAERVFHWRREQVIGLDIAEVVIPPEMRDSHRQGMRRHLMTGASTILDRRLELVAIRAGGERFPVELTVTRIDGEPAAYFTAFIRDLTEQKRLLAAEADHARYDVVTGLERYSVLEPQMIRAVESGTAFAAVIFIDLDRFHGINGSLGHKNGDEVLRAVGVRLLSLASEQVAVCHFASDEFVVIQQGGDRTAAERLAESVRMLLTLPFEGLGYRVLLTATIGISYAPAHGHILLDLMRRAQAAAERGKILGRNCVCPFQIEDMQDIEDRIVIGRLLQEAVQAEELALQYQPQFAASDMRLIGFESLLRWHSPILGDVSPEKFVPIAEGLGLIREIGEWVIREACRQIRLWLDAGHTGFTVAVNVSPQQLRRAGLHRTVDNALQEFRLPGHMLEIELTESSVLENLVRVKDELRRLKALGVLLTLDDFGTGHSSLAYLKHFAWDKLKIDKSFVRGLPHNALDASVARAIVTLARDLALRITAEGVETTAQAEFLRDLGCDELQGYLMGLPASADQARIHFES